MEITKEYIEKKHQELSELRKEIDIIEIEFAKNNSKFKQGDIVVSSNIKNTIFKITGSFDYSLESDLIYADCSVVSTSNKYIKTDLIYTISEPQLSIEENGQEKN
jgi:hypothetical protein